MLWIAFVSFVFYPQELNPVDFQTLNYAHVAVGMVLTYTLGLWAIIYSKRPQVDSRAHQAYCRCATRVNCVGVDEM